MSRSGSRDHLGGASVEEQGPAPEARQEARAQDPNAERIVDDDGSEEEHESRSLAHIATGTREVTAGLLMVQAGQLPNAADPLRRDRVKLRAQSQDPRCGLGVPPLQRIPPAEFTPPGRPDRGGNGRLEDASPPLEGRRRAGIGCVRLAREANRSHGSARMRNVPQGVDREVPVGLAGHHLQREAGPSRTLAEAVLGDGADSAGLRLRAAPYPLGRRGCRTVAFEQVRRAQERPPLLDALVRECSALRGFAQPCSCSKTPSAKKPTAGPELWASPFLGPSEERGRHPQPTSRPPRSENRSHRKTPARKARRESPGELPPDLPASNPPARPRSAPIRSGLRPSILQCSRPRGARHGQGLRPWTPAPLRQ